MILKAKNNSDLFADNSGLDDKFYYIWGVAVNNPGADLSGFEVPETMEELTTDQANTYFISKGYTPTNFF
tara:strand:+ start:52 stop:261 length:210 start_codon:yes stop_codon:yes gene_type:complete